MADRLHVPAARAAALLALPFLGAGVCGAQEAEEMVNCVSVPRIDRTEVVDDTTILFHMRGDEIYRNVLPHRCPGLEREERFMYRVTTMLLCNVDVVTVLEDFGANFMPGASCGLGKFQPISESEAEEMLALAESDE